MTSSPSCLRALPSTPYGLTSEYIIHHGGAQGDSMGVGTYSLIGIHCTKFHQGIIPLGGHGDDLRLHGRDPLKICFTSPFDDSLIIPEVCLSDDRRLFARSDVELGRLIDLACHGCWAACGAENGS